MNGSQARGIVTRKTLAAGQRIGIDLHLMTQGFELPDTALESRLVAHRTRGRVDIDVLAAMAVIMTAAAAVLTVHMVVVIVTAMFVMYMVCMAMFMRVIVLVVIALLGGGCRGFARACQSLFMQPLATCSMK